MTGTSGWRSLMYANKAMAYIKERHPDVPVIYYANGGSPYLESQRDMSADMITLDWATDMKTARQRLGSDILVQGNVDPTLLFGTDEQIAAKMREDGQEWVTVESLRDASKWGCTVM